MHWLEEELVNFCQCYLGKVTVSSAIRANTSVFLVFVELISNSFFNVVWLWNALWWTGLTSAHSQHGKPQTSLGCGLFRQVGDSRTRWHGKHAHWECVRTTESVAWTVHKSGQFNDTCQTSIYSRTSGAIYFTLGDLCCHQNHLVWTKLPILQSPGNIVTCAGDWACSILFGECLTCLDLTKVAQLVVRAIATNLRQISDLNLYILMTFYGPWARRPTIRKMRNRSCSVRASR